MLLRVVLLGFFGLSAGLTHAQTFRDWTTLSSGGGGPCIAQTRILLAGRATPLVTMSILSRKGADAETVPATVTLRVPVGVSLVSGIAYRHKGAAQAVGLAWQFCDHETCVASGGVSRDELERLKAALSIEVAYRPLPGSRPLAVPVSLLGFTRAWQAVRACG